MGKLYNLLLFSPLNEYRADRKTMAKKTVKITKKMLILQIVATLVTCVTLLTTVVFAWFSMGYNPKTEGLTFVTYYSNISFSNSVTLKRYITPSSLPLEYHYLKYSGTYNNKTYDGYYLYSQSASGDGYFYPQGKSGGYKLTEDNKLTPISFSGLFPGEKIEIFIELLSEGDAEKLVYDIGFSGISADTIQIKGVDEIIRPYSTLCIFKAKGFKYSASEGIYKEAGDWQWLADYSSEPATVLKRFSISGNWAQDRNTNNSLKIMLSLSIDMEKYYLDLPPNKPDNLLSEKNVSISEIFVTAH